MAIIEMHQNPELKLASDFLLNTSENIFLTGKAGTGKTTFLQTLRKTCPKRMVVLSPTGVAAINAGGVTIHSFFQMPFGPWLPDGRTFSDGDFRKGLNLRFHKFSREKRNIIRSLDLIVIDEISMVRADLLDGIDELLRRFRDKSKPFGGAQMLLIGDIQQLAPVVKNDEWEILKNYYDNPWFFSSKALEESNYLTIELKRVYRQKDQEFIDILNKIRHSDKDPAVIEKLNERYDRDAYSDTRGAIILTTHNSQAKQINDNKLNNLPGKFFTFSATIEKDFPEYYYPTDVRLKLKTGAQVMFVKNDSSPEKRYFNGKIGVIESIEDDIIIVKCPDDDAAIRVGPEIWQNAKYSLDKDTNEIVETIIGTFQQYPLKTAWAITIHKSQGLTFEKVIIDAANAFAHGQVYVALSRCKTLDGLTLSSPIGSRALISNSSVNQFTKGIADNQPDEKDLKKATISYQHSLILDLFNFLPLKRSINGFMNLIVQNNIRLPSVLFESFRKKLSEMETDIFVIERKFITQIDSLFLQNTDIRQNISLQDRIRKAVPYFLEKVQLHINSFLKSASQIDYDNKESKKALTVCLRRIEEQLHIKTATLQSCSDGFTVKRYLEARSKSAIEKPVQKKQPLRSDDLHNADMDLYQILGSWRDEKASSLDLAPYMILPYKTLMEISEKVPKSLAGLKKIKGIGKKKLKEFGNEIIELTCKFSGITPEKADQITEVENAQLLAAKRNTKEISFELFKSGKGIPEIASQRNLTLSTIEKHLSHYIGTGQISISRFLTEDKTAEIKGYFQTAETKALSAAKSHFGDRVTYGELHMVLAHMRHTEDYVFAENAD
ncbi:MAG TPA: helix-turn-helix domain-containing protein [Chitinispirillaceae bacterium]|nr:helix-turn-helix domain-containing protein [Chitinispirillaceae bacterium]